MIVEIDFQDGEGFVAAHRHTNPDGTEGGWVADTATVAETAYIGPNALVLGQARVTGNARVYEYAQVSGWAQVYDEAKISGNAQVFGWAQVFGNARVFGNAQISGNTRVSGDAHVSGNARVYDEAKISGNAWVYEYAQVSGNARVYEYAQVSGNAKALSNARVYDEARVSGNAWVSDYAWVSGKAKVSGDARVRGSARVYGDVMTGAIAKGVHSERLLPPGRSESGELYIMCDCETTGPVPGVGELASAAFVAIFGGKVVGQFGNIYLRFQPEYSHCDWSWHLPTKQFWDSQPENVREEAVGFSGERVSRREGADLIDKYVSYLTDHFGVSEAIFVGHPAGFDFPWINHLFYTTLGRNPFGYRSLCVRSFGHGLVKGSLWEMGQSEKEEFFVEAEVAYHPLSDALAQAHTFCQMLEAQRKE